MVEDVRLDGQERMTNERASKFQIAGRPAAMGGRSGFGLRVGSGQMSNAGYYRGICSNRNGIEANSVGTIFLACRVLSRMEKNKFNEEGVSMKRIVLSVLFSATIVSLMLVTSGPASAQMTGGMMAGQGQMQHHPMHMHRNMQSMHSMMQEMHGMMMEMHGMMQGNQGMMGMSAMSGTGTSKDEWPAMMRSMNTMGESMQQMLKQMDAVMSNKDMMSNPEIKASMGAMHRHMRSMMDSMHGVLHNLKQMQKPRRGSPK